jgi:hypothetical protein
MWMQFQKYQDEMNVQEAITQEHDALATQANDLFIKTKKDLKGY